MVLSTFALGTALLMGIGATVAFDLWGQFMWLVFKVRPSSIRLVGRWLLHMPAGVFRHARIDASPPMRFECAVGWIAHYAIGMSFALAFAGLAGEGWLRQPTLTPALGFGIVTVLAPLFIMQPAMGLGFAASAASNPGQARLRSLLNHVAFGIGLYLSAWLASAVV